MATRNARFQRGSGSYKCEICGRQTRDTGDNAQSRLCPQCWDLAGYENQLNDYGIEEWTDSETATVRSLILEVEARGGKEIAVREWRQTFSAVLDPTPEGAEDRNTAAMTEQEAYDCFQTPAPVPPTPSIEMSVLQGERSMRYTEYRNLVGRLAVEVNAIAGKLDSGRVSTHDGINLSRSATDLASLAAVLDTLDRAIASCK